MGLNEKLLSMSNSYVYYKSEFESLKKELDEKNKIIKGLNNELEVKNNSINDFKQKNEDYKKLVSILESKMHDYRINSFKKKVKDLNIAYILNGFPIHSETFIVNEVRWLKENGYNIMVFIKTDEFKIVPIDFNVEIIKFNNSIDLEYLLIKHEIDLLHSHFVYPICTNFTYPIAEKLKIPFTVFAHAYDIFIKYNDEHNKIKEISESDYCISIFTLSNFHKNYLMDRGVKSDKIVITKQATSYELSEIENNHNDIKKIISISRFVEKKGLDVLIDAANLLKDEDYEFSIYGFGDLENKLQNQIDKLRCTNISIKGELSPSGVEKKLKESDLLISPCKIAKSGDMDGFPTVIFESMATGLPILTTSVSAIPEIIQDGVNGFITEPNNPEMLADKILEITNISADEMFKIRKRAQNDVKNISSVDKTMEKYVKIIENNYFVK